MRLTLSKRFEYSASCRLGRADWPREKNLHYFGPGVDARYGVGYNFIANLVFSGPIDPDTGMLINVAVIKERFNQLLARRYDHKNISIDSPPFDSIPATPENLARHLLAESAPLFSDLSARPVACYLQSSPETAAIAYADGRIEREYWLTFSAARRTYAPQLSDDENIKLFGRSSGKAFHGHNYRMRIVLAGPVDEAVGVIASEADCQGMIQQLRAEFDHKNLNLEIPMLAGLPITTESLARFFQGYAGQKLPVQRLRLYETDDFFAETDRDGTTRMGLVRAFHATHRLNSEKLSASENLTTYDKCNHPAGHGHRYQVEATIGGPYDERSGTVADLVWLDNCVTQTLSRWNCRHLDLELPQFVGRPSTGEHIAKSLWQDLDGALDRRLVRLRLWETPNNRFTLRSF